MTITNELLVELNLFRNDVISKIEENEKMNLPEINKKLDVLFDDLEILYMSENFPQEDIKQFARELGMIAFLFYSLEKEDWV